MKIHLKEFLHIPTPKLPLVLVTNASTYGLLAVLLHVMPNNAEELFGFVSITLTNAGKIYNPVDKEALCIIFGIKTFLRYLYGT